MEISVKITNEKRTKKGELYVYFDALKAPGVYWAVSKEKVLKWLGVEDISPGLHVKLVTEGSGNQGIIVNILPAEPASVFAGRTGATRRTAPRKKNAGTPSMPYGFAPIDLGRAVSDEPVWHDGSGGGELLSGELLCTLTTLTPFLAGNLRYPVGEADRESLRRWGFGNLPLNKQIAEPLRIVDVHGNVRLVISGSALKGLLRSSVSALLNAPMERVGDEHYSYRPNAGFARPARLETRPALITAFDADGAVHLDVFWTARDADFVTDEAHGTLTKIFGSASGQPVERLVQGVSLFDERGKKRLVAGGNAQLNHRWASYRGGIDGEGKLAAAFSPSGKTYRSALVPKSPAFRLKVSSELHEIYRRGQETVLADIARGHLRDHPLKKPLEENRSSLEEVSRLIRSNIELKTGQLIYVELSTDAVGKFSEKSEITSFGRHFLYRWPYTSSVCTQNGQRRAILGPLPDELETTESGAPKKLAGARLLFGYASNDKELILGKGEFRRLAGRIAPNHAISMGTPEFLGTRETGYCIPLPTLGNPKASSWEHYLRQDFDAPQSYGDTPSDAGGELAGRKMYVHQTDEATLKNIKQGIATAQSDLATLARYIAMSGTKFRFVVRFARLRPWELGALLIALEPHRLSPGCYAHKLGAGRPIGMGSVAIKIDGVRLREERASALRDDEHLVAAALASFKEKVPDLPLAWLNLLRVPETKADVGYPTLKQHAEQKRSYAQERREKGTRWAITDAFIARLPD